MGLAFEGEDMGADAVKEEAVVADHHGAACEIRQRVFERAQGFHVQIVGRFVQQKNISA